MTTAHVFIATSLDGYISRLDGDIDWLTSYSTLGEDHGYDSHISQMDGVIMGRGTYEKVIGFDQWYYTKPTIVLSRSLDPLSVPDHLKDRIEIIAVTPQEVMAFATSRGWKKVYVDGGQVIQSFLREGLIEDLIISRIPILLGAGIPLFGDTGGRDIALEHLSTKAFSSGLVQSHYQMKR